MNKREKFVSMGVISFGSAVIMAGILALVPKTVATYTIPGVNLTLSRWWDIPLLLIWLNLILGFWYFLVPYLVKRYEIAEIEEVDLWMPIISGFGFALLFGVIGRLDTGPEGGIIWGLLLGLPGGLGMAVTTGRQIDPVIGLAGRLVCRFVSGLAGGLGMGLAIGFVSGFGIGVPIGLASGLAIGLTNDLLSEIIDRLLVYLPAKWRELLGKI